MKLKDIATAGGAVNGQSSTITTWPLPSVPRQFNDKSVQLSIVLYFASDKLVLAFVPTGLEAQAPPMRLLEPASRWTTILNSVLRAPHSMLNTVLAPALATNFYVFPTRVPGVGDLRLVALRISSDDSFPCIFNGVLRDASQRQYNAAIKCILDQSTNLKVAEFGFDAVMESCPAPNLRNAGEVGACVARNQARAARRQRSCKISVQQVCGHDAQSLPKLPGMAIADRRKDSAVARRGGTRRGG